MGEGIDESEMEEDTSRVINMIVTPLREDGDINTTYDIINLAQHFLGW